MNNRSVKINTGDTQLPYLYSVHLLKSLGTTLSVWREIVVPLISEKMHQWCQQGKNFTLCATNNCHLEKKKRMHSKCLLVSPWFRISSKITLARGSHWHLYFEAKDRCKVWHKPYMFHKWLTTYGGEF